MKYTYLHNPDPVLLKQAAEAIRRDLETKRDLNLKLMAAWRGGFLGELWREMRRDGHLSRAYLHYFIRARGIGDIKIGRTNNIDSRFMTVLTHCSRGADLVAIYPDLKEHEKELHEEFAHLRLSGEWFDAHPELTDYLELLGASPRDVTNTPLRPFQRRVDAKIRSSHRGGLRA